MTHYSQLMRARKTLVNARKYLDRQYYSRQATWDPNATYMLAKHARIVESELRTIRANQRDAKRRERLERYTDAGRDKWVAAGEGKDCTVRAIAAVCSVSYDLAHSYLEGVGRVRGKGYQLWGHLGVCRDIFGHHITRLTPMRLTLARAINTYRSGRYILGTCDHAMALIDGKVVDTFLQGARTRVWFVYRVEVAQ